MRKFEQLWAKLRYRTSTTTLEVGISLSPIFKSDLMKGVYFLAILPPSMNHVIQDLSLQKIIKFSDIAPVMLNIGHRREK